MPVTGNLYIPSPEGNSVHSVFATTDLTGTGNLEPDPGAHHQGGNTQDSPYLQRGGTEAAMVTTSVRRSTTVRWRSSLRRPSRDR